MANIKTRVLMKEQHAEQRIKNFNEVPLGYTIEEAIEEAKRCLQCRNAFCTKNCPINVDIKRFVKLLSEGDLKGAFLKIKENCPTPAITGRVCPQENQCEEACALGKANKGNSINIGKLAAFLADWAMKNGIKEKVAIKIKNQKVVMVGSGPASIGCAVDLRKRGYRITIFEALHKAGGVLQYGIPSFRLPKEIVDRELLYLKELGIEVKLNTIVGQNISFDELKKKYDAIFIGTGAGAPIFLGIEGEKLNGFYSANEFLIRINLMKAYDFPNYDTPIIVGKKVGVIGAGNVAIDTARSAVRLGTKVYILYRRTKEYSPAREEEMRHAIEEGVNFVESVSPIRILGKDGRVKGIELVKMKLGDVDKSGRPRPIPIKGSEFVMSLDTVIVALGTRPNRLFLSKTNDLKIKEHGEIITDENFKSNIDGVFAGGDAVNGGATVIKAMGDGRKAAKTIHKFLLNKSIKS